MKRYSVRVELPSWEVLAESEDEAIAHIRARVRRDYGPATVIHAEISIHEVHEIKGKRQR